MSACKFATMIPWQEIWAVDRQECIPVGCVPPAAVAARGWFSTSPQSRHPPQTRHPPGPGTAPGADTPQDQAPPPSRDQVPPGPGNPPLLWTEFLTHACENITLPQTSFAGGNKLRRRGERSEMSWCRWKPSLEWDWPDRWSYCDRGPRQRRLWVCTGWL